jgi:uncharacterized protein (DUF1697 family)
VGAPVRDGTRRDRRVEAGAGKGGAGVGKTWIALLRGINVLGRNKLPMKEFAASLEAAGFVSVRTYIQSGNVVFCSARGAAGILAARMEELVLENFGFAPRIMLITAAELAAAVRANPFPGAEVDHKSLHLYFLSRTPSRADLATLARIDAGRDEFAVKGGVLYLYTPDGFAESRLRSRVERGLGVAATARNWRTVKELLRMANPP